MAKKQQAPEGYTPDGPLKATLDLDRFGWGTFEILDCKTGDYEEIGRIVRTGALETLNAALVRIYCGSGSVAGEGKPAWPERGSKDWKPFVRNMPSVVTETIASAVSYFRGQATGTNDDDDGSDSYPN